MLNEVNLIDNEDTFKVLQLSSLIVATPYRNQGIGKALVQAVEERAKAHHYTAIIVDGCRVFYSVRLCISGNIILYRKMMISLFM